MILLRELEYTIRAVSKETDLRRKLKGINTSNVNIKEESIILKDDREKIEHLLNDFCNGFVLSEDFAERVEQEISEVLDLLINVRKVNMR